jgi:hypothetical protein
VFSQAGGQRRVPAPVQVHAEECHVVGHVEVPEPLVELDAIVNRHAIVGEVDVLQAQVPMAVHEVAPGPPVVEKGRVLVVKAVGIVLKCPKSRA